MKKRVLSLFLALTLCLTLLPTAAFAEGKTGGEDGTSDGSEPQYVAQVGETKYETMQDALDEMSEDEITLLDDINEAELSTSVPTTINMNGYSITGDIEANDSLTLENGTVKGKVTVDAADGAFIMTAPAGAEAAIDGGLEVNDGSCSVSGAKIGVKDTLFFGGTDMVITGTDKAVELTAAAEPSGKKFHGSTNVDGGTAEEATFDGSTYQVSGGVAKKLSYNSVTPEPSDPTLTLSPTEKTINAGETATFTATYTGTGTLNAYIQKNGLDQNFDVSTPTNNGGGTYTITVKIAEETPTGDYTLYVHETKDTSMQAMAKIHVKGKDPVAEVIHPGATEGTKYFSLPAALDAAQDGDTVKLLADHTTNWSDVEASEYSTLAVIKKTLTLDLNGKTVDYLEVGEVVPDEEGGILVSTEGSLTIKDRGLGSVGTVSSLQLEKGKLTIEGGEIGEAGKTTSFVCSDETGEVNIQGGKVWYFGCEGGTANITGGTVYQLSVKKGVVNVSNGTSHGGWNNDSTNYDSATWSVNGGTLNITGGMFGKVRFNYTGGNIDLSGGTFQSISNSNASASAPVMSLLADGYAFYGKDESGEYTVLQSSEETSLTDVKVLEHTKHSFLNGACIACGALTCKEGACIAHWTFESPTYSYVEHFKTLQALAGYFSHWKWLDYSSVTVKFLTDVTVTDPLTFSQCDTHVILDLDGHTISGKLDTPMIDVNFSYGGGVGAGNVYVLHCIAFQNGTIENTGSGAALRLSCGATTLENVNVNGDLVLTSKFASSTSYTPTFLGGGTFTKICALPDGSWQKTLEYMLPKGYYFADITTHKRVSQDALTIEDPLVNVTVLPCEHKDENGKSTFTVKHDRDDYFYCSICDNICPHESMTPNADGSMHCNDCTLDLAATATTKRGVTIYYIKLSDAFNSSTTGALLKPLHDQICTQLLLIYNGGYTIDLNGCTVTTQSESAPYIPDYTVTFQNSAEKPGSFVCNYIDVYGGGTLAVPAENNNLTISSVLFKQTGNGKLAGGSFGKITVESGKTLASLLVSGYCFTDSKSGKGAALYDADGNALTELTNVTVRLCSHDEAVYGSGGTWVCPCGQKTFVASITKGEATTYYTDLQEAFKAADGGDTVKLLAAASGTVNINKVFALDLNGYGAEEINVSAKATIKDSGETKGMIGKLTVSADGLTIGDLLEMGYAFKYENGNWMSNDRVTEGSSIAIHLAPIASVTLRAKDADGEEVSTTMPYGTTGAVRLDAACGQPYGATQATCVITKIEGGTMTSVSNFPGYTLPDDLTAGEHTYRVTFTSDGYSKSAEITITVTPVSLAGAIVAVGDLTYNGDAQTPEVTVTLDKKVLTKDKDYTLTGAEQTNAGSYHLTVTGKGGYEGEIGNVDWKIEPKTVTNPTINVAPCVYNGFEQTPRVELKDGERGIPEGEYTVAYSNNINAGDGSLTIQDAAGGNYVVSGSTTFPIEQASINTSNRWIEVRVFNELAKTYEVELQPNLDNILYEQRIDGTFGTVTYSLDEDGASTYADYYELGTAKIENGKLILPIKNGSGVPSGNYIVTLMLRVESTNFKSFDLPVHIIARDKIVPRLAEGSTVSATDITYGQTLADSMLTVTGSMEAPSFDAPGTIQEVTGTFAWTDGTIRPEASDYEAEWTFTPDASYGGVYANATGKVKITVSPAQLQDVSVLVPNTYYYTGEPQRAGVIAAGLGVCGEQPTFTYSKTENGEYTSEVPEFTEAGTYTVYYKAEAVNHITATGTFSVQIKPLPISLLAVEKISKTYDGTASVTLSTEMLTFFSKAARRSDIKLPILALSFSNARFTMKQADGSYVDSPEVGGGKALSFTMTLESDNYVFEREPEGTKTVKEDISTDDATKFTITKADAPRATIQSAVTVINGLAKTYEMVLTDNLPKLSSPCEYGSVSYSVKGTYLTDGYKDTVKAEIVEENGQYKLKLTVPAVDYDRESSVGTLDIKVVSDNYQDFTLTIGVKAKNKTVPMPDGEISATDITYGQTLADSKITGKMKDGNKEVTGTFAWKDGTIKPNAGSYEAEWTFTPDASNGGIYANATGKVSVKVNPKDIKGATVTLKSDSFEYDGTRKDPEVASVVLDGETLVYGQYNDYGYHYDMASDVGTYNLVVGGNHNYTGSVSVTWSITPKTVTPTIEVASCSYTGDTLTPDVTLTDDIGNTIDPKEYTVSYSNNTNAGTGTVTIKDAAGGNYVLNEASTTFTITKAAAPTLEDIVISHKYTVTTGEKTIGSTMPVDAGALSFTKGTESTTGSVTVSGWAVDAATGKVTYTLSSGTAGDTVTLPVTISSTNYADTVINVVITLTRRDDQAALVITGADAVIYGEKLILTTTGGSGTGAVTYRIDTAYSTGEATIDPETGVLTPVKVGSVSVIATKAGDKDYNDVTSAPFVLMIKPASPTGEPKYTEITTSGKTLKDAVLTTEGSTLSPKDGKLEWVDDEGDVLPGDTWVEANKTYKWRFTPTDTNYTTMTGEIELYHKSSSGGGSGSNSGSYTITVKDAQNGDVTTDRKSASAGTTVTITVKPDSGYVLDDLTVTDSKGNDIKLTGKGGGKYTFTMPSGKATVEASFTPAKSENPFTDVPSGAYYEDAVAWAVNNGITGGTSATTFAPDGFCTRAQAVTFLWRAAGSPAPKSTAMAFTDVPAGSYYYDAVLWAIENGVTKGTSDTTFSPNANCSRGQIVTFLWRSQKSPDAAAANPFTDVAANAYYTSAVLWAVEKSITGGTSATTFSPSANCTRAQIVTFIYRCMK